MAVGAYGVAICCRRRSAGACGSASSVGILSVDRCSPCCSASRRCDCAATTWPSSRSRRRRSSDSSLRSEALEDVTGGNSGINGFANAFYDLNPFTERRASTSSGRSSTSARDLWVHDRRLDRGRPGRPGHVPAHAQPVGSGAASPSARTRTRSGRSARTCTRYKMQALMIGGVVGALGGILRCDRRPVGAARRAS